MNKSFAAPALLALAASCAPPKPAPVVDSSQPPARPAVASARPPWASLYPPARIDDVVEERFGVRIADPYRWLEDGKSSEVQAWRDAEGALARRSLDTLPDRAPLLARMREVMHADARELPIVAGERRFFMARSVRQEKSALHWTDSAGADHVLLDPNAWPAADNPSIQSVAVSPDGTKVAYVVSLHNADTGTIRVVDVATGEVSHADSIPEVNEPDVSWPDARGFFYRAMPAVSADVSEAKRWGLATLRYHRLGDDPSRDPVVHAAVGDPVTWLHGGASRDGHWLFASVEHGDTSSDIEFRDLRAGRASVGPWSVLIRSRTAKYSVVAHRDRFYVWTNEGAPNSRLFAVDPAQPARASWAEIVPERKDATLEGFTTVGDRLVLLYRKDVVARLEVHRLDGALAYEVPLPEPGVVDLSDAASDEHDVYFEFSSFTHPPEIRKVTVDSGAASVWYHTDFPGDLSRFVTEELFATSKDGTRVPMFVVHARDMKRDGTAPALLQAYGGFGIPQDVTFRANVIPWLEHGGVFAQANLRGGGEYGEVWHRAGMRHGKQHVFDDEIAAAEQLASAGFTRSDRLVLYGRSNGGLLMGAVTTERPDLARVVLCGAPVLDMIRFPLVGAGVLWTDEYGDPNVEEDFRALAAYSPVHNVHPGTRYPSFLMLSPADDDRVDPMHARKLVAALQAASIGGPVLMRVERNAGHFGADSREMWAQYWADAYAFALAEIARPGSSMPAR